MGYTHRWSINAQAPNMTQEIAQDLMKILELSQPSTIQDIAESENGLSFTDASKQPGEQFRFPGNNILQPGDTIFGRPVTIPQGWPAKITGFCKTAQNPYDRVVTALLYSIKHHHGDNVRIGSDGCVLDDADFGPGRKLYESVTGRTAPELLNHKSECSRRDHRE